MKIWTIAFDTDHGTYAVPFLNEEAAQEAYIDAVNDYITDEMPTAAPAETFEEAQKLWDILISDYGVIDTVCLEEHDI